MANATVNAVDYVITKTTRGAYPGTKYPNQIGPAQQVVTTNFNDTAASSITYGSAVTPTLALPNALVPDRYRPNANSASVAAGAGGGTGGGGTVTNAASTVTLSASPTSSTYGQTVVLTAACSGAYGTPTGTVTFYDGGNVLGTATISGGSASLSTAAIRGGSRTLYATYSGDATYASANSNNLSFTCTSAATTTTLTVSPNPAAAGSVVTFTAKVSGGNVSGNVTFQDGGVSIGTAALDNTGTATLTKSNLITGTHTIAAVYAGDTNYAGSSSSSTSLQITAAATSLKLTCSRAGTSSDYIKYLYANPVRTDRINEPDYLDLQLVPWDVNFVPVKRGDYMTFSTGTFGVWFTGYVTSDPEIERLGTKNGVVIYGYKVRLTGDDYAFNLHPIGVMSPFLNTSMGAILRALIQRLNPSSKTYDLSAIQDGIMLARYIVNPDQKFTDVVKDFCEKANYYWKMVNGQARFEPMDYRPAALTIDGNDKHFTPSNLTITPSDMQIVNDAIVIGDIEPQTYVTEFFVGDGFTKKFSLGSGVFGSDSAILLDDDFQGGQIDTQKWAVYDAPQNYIQMLNGYVNAVGGRNDGSMSVWMQSANLIALEGHLRITHGEWDFVQASDGLICAIMSDVPDQRLSNCVYGLRVTKSGTNTIIQPMVNGYVDGTQSMTISNYNYRYIIRTIYGFDQIYRYNQAYAYLDGSGAVGTEGGNTVGGNAVYQTWIAIIDPATGSTVDTKSFSNTTTGTSATYGFYAPIVLNDLHATFTGVTIWNPIQAALDIKPAGSGSYYRQPLGPVSEMDSLDQMAPVAGITTSGGGATSRNSKLGTQVYNPGNATLEFISDTVDTTNATNNPFRISVPQRGDIIRLMYRSAGPAVGRVQDAASIQTEASGFGDDGVRSVVRRDVKPLPRTAAECESAARAMVGNFSRQHWNGTYSGTSLYSFTDDPHTGTVLKFQNMPSAFPATLTAEVIQEVQTTFVCSHPAEIFEYQVKFGTLDLVKKVAATFIGQATGSDSAATGNPQDAAEIPDAIDINAVGTTFANDIVSPQLTSWTTDTYTIDAGVDPPSGGGFEVRYSDESWGSDDSRNLIVRTQARVFTVPRNARSKVIFIKAYDGRNKVSWSEDLTKWVGNGGTVNLSNSTTTNPQGRLATVTTVSLPSFASGSQIQIDTGVAESAGLKMVYTISLRAATSSDVGKTVRALIQSSASPNTVWAFQDVTLTSDWQDVVLPFTATASTANSTYRVAVWTQANHAVFFQASQASFEINTITPTAYAKTTGSSYGATSRYPAMLRITFPQVPPAPVAVIDANDLVNPTIYVTIPAAASDIYGYEIRSSDNKTVLDHKDLTDVSNNLAKTIIGNQQRDLLYYAYFYNLLDEFSPAYTVQQNLSLPAVTNMTVDDSTKRLSWQGLNGDSYLIEIATDVDFTDITTAVTTPDQFVFLEDIDFFNKRFVRVTPYDVMGSGTPSPIFLHQYIAQSVSSFGPNEAFSIGVPTDPYTTSSAPGAIFVQPGFNPALVAQMQWSLYNLNQR